MESLKWFFVLSLIIYKTHGDEKIFTDPCNLSEELKAEIASYKSLIQDIMDLVSVGPLKGRTYKELAEFVDKFGPRPSGSDELETSIDYMINITKAEDLNNITTEEVEVPHWIRGHESVTMLEPRRKDIAVLGLGKSISTPAEGITAEVVVVSNFEELANVDVTGKIVLYDVPFTTYGETVLYRTKGASEAAQKGAVAALVRSITPFSINSPHTGSMEYQENVMKIPAAAITVEDSELIRRKVNRGLKVVLNIKLTSLMDKKKSRNTIIDLVGRESDDLVIVSGHIDSWDVGQGAMDDGGGIFVSWMVPIVLNYLKLRPKRTVRTIFWTAEELGLVGAYAYEARHKKNLHKINFIMESDEGTFNPRGLVVTGNREAKCIVKEVLKWFEPFNATTLIEDDSAGSDISVIIKNGVPGASLYNGDSDDKYFWFHHTEADTMTVENSEELDRCTAFWSAFAYIIADLSVNIPR